MWSQGILARTEDLSFEDSGLWWPDSLSECGGSATLVERLERTEDCDVDRPVRCDCG